MNKELLGISVIAFLIIAESLSPLLKVSLKKRMRHIFLNLVFFAIARVIFLGLTSVSLERILPSRSGDWAISNLPYFWQILVSIILLDFFLWLQHVISHRINFLWRLHKVHHCDEYLDLTSALRFHPIELILSYFYKFLLVWIFGISLESFLIFEAMIPLFAMFNHSNLHLPKFLDKLLGLFVVTPNFHQVHHSDLNKEMNTNFGTIFPYWDQLTGMYTSFYQKHDKFKLGLRDVSLADSRSVLKLFVLPFKRP